MNKSLYIPVYDAGRRQVWSIPSKDIRINLNIKRAKYAGYLFNIDMFYSTEEGAWAYWNYNYKTQRRYKLTAEEVIKAVKDAGGVIYGGDYRCA